MTSKNLFNKSILAKTGNRSFLQHFSLNMVFSTHLHVFQLQNTSQFILVTQFLWWYKPNWKRVSPLHVKVLMDWLSNMKRYYYS